MGLNIKNERTIALVRELAKRTGLTQTGAIDEAVRAMLTELDRAGVGTRRRRHARRAKTRQLLDELRTSLTQAERAKLKTAESQLYDDAGLPS
ncbi:MAG: type II toxin-antitoxin system VapB family antitoxin [Mycobacterium sp.]